MNIIIKKETRLSELENEIEQNTLAFVKVGNALLEINRDNLYKPEYKTFKEYLKKRWKWGQRFAYEQMNAAYIRGYLEENCSIEQFPDNEGQTRPLKKLATFKAVETERKDPEVWVEAWEKAVEFADEDKSVVTDKYVEKAVNEIIKAEKISKLEPAKIWAGELELDQIYVADVTTNEWLDTIPENSIDFVMTDPPWRPDEEKGEYALYDTVGKISSKVLKPGGYCAVYLGKLDLPILFQIMTKYLDYEWCFAVYYPNGGWNFRKTQVKECWRPIGIFRKIGERTPTVYIPDAMTSVRDKTYHEWQQGIEPIKALIEKYTAPGQLVLDPFVGGGTASLAAKLSNRHYLAFDIDADTVAIAQKRMTEDV